MKFILPILLLLCVVLVSGCTSTTAPVLSGDGIVIRSFSAEPVQVDENDLVNFNLDIENIGTTTASCVRADIMGLEGWRYQGNTITANIEGFYGEWDITSGQWNIFKQFKIDPCKIPWLNSVPVLGGIACNLPPVVVNMDCGSEQGCNLDVFWGEYESKIACSTDTLHPVLSKWGRETLKPRESAVGNRGEEPGGFKTAEWAFTPPDLPEGVVRTVTVYSRVTYLYKTTGSIGIPALSEDEYNRLYSRGVVVNEPIIQDHSDSPVIMEVERAPSPIIVDVPGWRAGGDDVQYEQLKFRIKNIGSGFPITGNENGLMVGTITLAGTGVEFDDCLGQTGGQTLLIDGSKADLIKLSLPSGERAFGCGIRINIPPWDAVPRGTISFTYDLRYQYYTTAQTDVQVRGK